jgi:large subunit ribosomal protein L28
MYAAPVAWIPPGHPRVSSAVVKTALPGSTARKVRDHCASGVVNVSASEVFGVTPVAANCDVCGKGPGFGNNISHSHRRTRRRWNPNIQTVRAVIGRTPKRLNVCTSCIKAGKVSR